MKVAKVQRLCLGSLGALGVVAGLCGCATPSGYWEAEARRLEAEREGHPALYELNRDYERRHPKSLGDYQREADDYPRGVSK